MRIIQRLLFTFIIVLAYLIAAQQVVAQDNYFQDTVWMQETDQTQGFYMVKFSPDDQLIAAHGAQNVLFFDAISGDEIIRISGNNEVFFTHNNQQFIILNEEGSSFKIYNRENWQIDASLENDGKEIYPISGISSDGKYLASIIQGGIRIWDLETGTIFKTKYYESEENLYKFNIEQLKFTCDNMKIICTEYKEYYNNDDPPKVYSTLNHVVYDFNSLDSVDAFSGMAYFRLSNTCSMIAFKRSNPDFGVEVYDYYTAEIIWRLPINGPSLTGIEFSTDDQYLVTSSSNANDGLKIWSLENGEKIYNYPRGSYRNININKNGNYIISTTGQYIFLINANWEGTPVEEEEKYMKIIFPNPSTGTTTISFENPIAETTTIILYDINGLKIREIINDFLDSGHQDINMDVSDLANGSYKLVVNNSQLSLFFQLIINK